jgi:hypothetical protein
VTSTLISDTRAGLVSLVILVSLVTTAHALSFGGVEAVKIASSVIVITPYTSSSSQQQRRLSCIEMSFRGQRESFVLFSQYRAIMLMVPAQHCGELLLLDTLP